jgi:hypothetical protein
MKRFAFAAILSCLVMFSLAGLYTGVLAREFITSHVDPSLLRTPPNLLLIVVGYFVLGLLMAWIYPRVVHNVISPVLSGFRFGIMVAVCWLIPYSLVLFGAYNFPYLALPLDFGWAFVEQGIGGAIIGLAYGKSTTRTQPGS